MAIASSTIAEKFLPTHLLSGFLYPVAQILVAVIFIPIINSVIIIF